MKELHGPAAQLIPRLATESTTQTTQMVPIDLGQTVPLNSDIPWPGSVCPVRLAAEESGCARRCAAASLPSSHRRAAQQASQCLQGLT